MMVTAVNEVNNDKTKVREYIYFVVFRLFVLLPNFICKLIDNRCKLTCKLIVKTRYKV